MNRFLKFEGVLLTSILFAFLLHYFTNNAITGKWHLEYGLPKMYLFLWILTGVLLAIFAWMFDAFKKHIGFAFMGATFLKIIISFVFLLPVIYFHQYAEPKVYVIHFMAAYLWVLFTETILVFLDLQKLNG